MDREKIKDRVIEVIAKVLDVNEDQITPDANFIFDLGADSSQSIELVAAFEEEFEIEMDEDSALGVQTVSGAVEFIANYLE
ncbi:MAG: acyl carrier protein [Candidatus Omnitrophota bacterium]|nr:MAG: acyl carrier protein [Candidatus Omnitrophota bacterium]